MKRLFDLFRRKPAPPDDGPRMSFDPEKAGALIIEQLRRNGMLLPPGTKVEVSHKPLWLDGEGKTHGIKPPDDTATEGWTWAAWSKEMAAMAFPGWSPCRFAHRSSPPFGNDQARFVFGITSGPFGIWKQDFDVCSLDDAGEHQREKLILACLTHLPSGMGLGIFRYVDGAALAADTMIRTCPQMADVAYDSKEGSPWSTAILRAMTAWKAIGIEPSANSHAHDLSTGSGPHFIMGLAENLEHGRPEKLS